MLCSTYISRKLQNIQFLYFSNKTLVDVGMPFEEKSGVKMQLKYILFQQETI